MDWDRLLKFTNYSDEAFEVVEYFEYIVTDSGVLCDELMCPDTSNVSLRIALMFANGWYREVEEQYDCLRSAEYYEYLQRSL